MKITESNVRRILSAQSLTAGCILQPEVGDCADYIRAHVVAKPAPALASSDACAVWYDLFCTAEQLFGLIEYHERRAQQHARRHRAIGLQAAARQKLIALEITRLLNRLARQAERLRQQADQKLATAYRP